MRTGAIVQARLNSQRLPMKVLCLLPNGKSILDTVLDNLNKCEMLNDIILTTPDEGLIYICKKHYLHTGKRDVIAEYYNAARKFNLDIIVRITADCPLINPEIVDYLIREFVCSDVDLIYNTECEKGNMTGDGLDVEVFNFSALSKANNQAKEREHVTSWMRKNLRTKFIPAPEFEGCSIDTQKDYKKVCDLMRRGKVV